MRRPPRPSVVIPTPTPNEAHQHDLAVGPATRMVADARIRTDDVVLEVGPGLGALTCALLASGARVVAIERDSQRVSILQKRFAGPLASGQLTLLLGDALRLTPTMSHPWRVLANPPFSLTAPLVRRWLLESQPAPLTIDLVLQREAALKLTGADGAHTRTSILAHLCGVPRVIRHLPRDVVTPPSRVDLAIWSHQRHANVPSANELFAVDRLLEIAFAGPHTMSEAMRGVATGIQVRRQASEHDWNPEHHPRTLLPAAWQAFAQLLVSCGRLGPRTTR
jgi:16S rRNA (adenine1518-N6/adenine1519-N6)-dimethyltransferase